MVSLNLKVLAKFGLCSNCSHLNKSGSLILGGSLAEWLCELAQNFYSLNLMHFTEFK